MLIGRDDFIMEKLAQLINGAAHKHHEVTNIRQVERGYVFDVRCLVDDEPSGHIAQVAVTLLEVEPEPGVPMEHKIVESVPTEIVDGYPKTEYRIGTRSACCAVCTNVKAGAPRGGWLRAHREHVRCTCGAVVTKRGYGSHVASVKRHRERRESERRARSTS